MIKMSPALAACVVVPGMVPAAQASVPSELFTATASPLDEKTPGPKGPTLICCGLDAVPLVTITITGAPPGTISDGTWRFTCPGDVNSIAAGWVLPPCTNCTLTPPSVLDNGMVLADAVPFARLVPKIEASEPGARGV